jgi:hypothetical protein
MRIKRCVALGFSLRNAGWTARRCGEWGAIPARYPPPDKFIGKSPFHREIAVSPSFQARLAKRHMKRGIQPSNAPSTVLEGEIRSQVNDGPVTTYKAGQSFSELPGDRHGVSANASETKPAKLLAVFVVDTNETELTIPFGN